MDTSTFTTTRQPWNKGKLVGQKNPFQTKGDMGDSHKTPNRKSMSRSRPFQPGHRQQAPRLRSHAVAGTGRLPRSQHGVSCPHPSTEDQPAGTVRNYRAGAHRCISMDFSLEPEIRGLPFSKPHPCITALVNASIRANCRFLGSSVGIGPRQLRHPYAAADEGYLNIPADKESARSTVASRP
jgi:hypothetical protein